MSDLDGNSEDGFLVSRSFYEYRDQEVLYSNYCTAKQCFSLLVAEKY